MCNVTMSHVRATTVALGKQQALNSRSMGLYSYLRHPTSKLHGQ